MPGETEIKHAAKSTFEEVIETVSKYLVPIGAGVAGFASAGLLGGSNSIWGLLPTAQQTPTNANLIKLGIGSLWTVVGFGFWSLRSKGGWILKLIGGGAGAFFMGAGLGYFSGALFNYSPPPNTAGLLDRLVDGISGLASGSG